MRRALVPFSRAMSFLLRHKPHEGDLTLDEHGWTSVVKLIGGLAKIGHEVSFAEIQEIVRENDKQRFELSPDGTRIRARQGHSVEVELGLDPTTPPDTLFHGTAREHLRSIRKQGLLRGARTHVHLTADEATAHQVGSRHGEAVVLRIDAAAAHAAGWKFYVTDNGVWLVDHVPASYLTASPD